MRRAFLGSFLAAMMVIVGVSQAQTPPAKPIGSFGEVAGKWDGSSAPSGLKVSFELSDKGAFWVSSSLGEQKGTATIEEGLLWVRYPNNQGYMKLSRVSDGLEGPAIYGARSGTIKFGRVK